QAFQKRLELSPGACGALLLFRAGALVQLLIRSRSASQPVGLIAQPGIQAFSTILLSHLVDLAECLPGHQAVWSVVALLVLRPRMPVLPIIVPVPQRFEERRLAAGRREPVLGFRTGTAKPAF